MKEFKNGLLTGLTLQLAIGPVFFFIINLALQKTIYDGLAGVLAVTFVDYLYILLSILGIGKLLEKRKFKQIFGITSSILLVIFGVLIFKGIFEKNTSMQALSNSSNLFSSFSSVFLITISSPMTIVFFTSLFTAIAIEYKYAKNELLRFGLGTGFATLLFMGPFVVFASLIKEVIPTLLFQVLNGTVGILLIGYGLLRMYRVIGRKK